MTADVLALGLMWYVAFLLSTTCHEASHALAAKRLGDLTAFRGGQVTLDPRPHVKREPFGMILVPLLSYLGGGWIMGWASAPYDPLWSHRYPHRAAKMALAGPLANFTLGILAGIAIHIGLFTGVFHPPTSAGFTRIVDAAVPGVGEASAKLLSILFSLNVTLGVFNLLPIPPLDGFSLIGLLMSEDMARELEDFGQILRRFAYLGMALSWQVFDVLYEPIFSFALRLLYLGSNYGA